MAAGQNFRVAGFVSGLAIKAPVRVATIAPITLDGVQTVDTVILQPRDRVLVKDQADPIENGVYSVQVAAWIRDGDFDGERDLVGGTVVPAYRPSDGKIVNYVTDGLPTAISIGVDPITFSVFFDSSSRAVLTPLIVLDTVDVDFSAGEIYAIDVEDATANFTVTLSNPPAAGLYGEVLIEFVQGSGGFDAIWPASVRWPQGGTAPVLTAADNSTDSIKLWTRDGGVTYKGSFLLDDQ